MFRQNQDVENFQMVNMRSILASFHRILHRTYLYMTVILGKQTTCQASGSQVQMLLGYASKQLSWVLTLVILESKHLN